jgi:hypothetical protein
LAILSAALTKESMHIAKVSCDNPSNIGFFENQKYDFFLKFSRQLN